MADQAFVPIRSGRAFHDVIAQITRAIRRGDFRPGDRLPDLDDMATALHTSKPTVREAYAVLVGAGVLDVRRGNSGGAIVRTAAVPPTVLGIARTPTATIPEILEARRPIETELAQLAGQRGNEDDFAAMAAAVDLLGPARGNPDAWVQANDLFHYHMAAAARSPRLARYANELMEELAVLLDDFDEHYVDFDHTVRVHRRTLEALRSGSRRRIASVMDEHMRGLEEKFL